MSGITVTKTITAPLTEPTEANLTLQWDPWSLAEGSYGNIAVSLQNEYDSKPTVTYSNTLIVDKTPPVITMTEADSSVELTLPVGGTFTDPGATATDSGGAGLMTGHGTLTGTGTVEPTKAGIYTLTYTASDNVGNTASTTRKVRVLDGDSVGETTTSNLDLSTTTAAITLKSSLTSLGLDQKTPEFGFVYREVAENEITDGIIVLDDITLDLENGKAVSLTTPAAIGTFDADLTDLIMGKNYYVRSYVQKDDNSYAYGPLATFSTISETEGPLPEALKPRIALGQASYTVSETAGTLEIVVSRTTTSGALTVNYAISTPGNNAATVGTDFTDTTTTLGALTFADAEKETRITITLLDDSVYEENEAFTVTLSNPSVESILVRDQSVVTITSDDVQTPGQKSVAKAITAFDLTVAGVPVAGTITESSHAITVVVPYGTVLTNLTPGITISPKSNHFPGGLTGP